MQKIFYTGLTKKKRKRNGSIPLACYLCKREKDSDSIVIVGEYESEIHKLVLKGVNFQNDTTSYKYMLCHECLLLLSALQDVKASQMTVDEDT